MTDLPEKRDTQAPHGEQPGSPLDKVNFRLGGLFVFLSGLVLFAAMVGLAVYQSRGNAVEFPFKATMIGPVVMLLGIHGMLFGKKSFDMIPGVHDNINLLHLVVLAINVAILFGVNWLLHSWVESLGYVVVTP